MRRFIKRNRLRQLLRQSGGFTLIEVIATVLILVVVSGALTVMVFASSNMVKSAQKFKNEMGIVMMYIETGLPPDGNVEIEYRTVRFTPQSPASNTAAAVLARQKAVRAADDGTAGTGKSVVMYEIVE